MKMNPKLKLYLDVRTLRSFLVLMVIYWLYRDFILLLFVISNSPIGLISCYGLSASRL